MVTDQDRVCSICLVAVPTPDQATLVQTGAGTYTPPHYHVACFCGWWLTVEGTIESAGHVLELHTGDEHFNV